MTTSKENANELVSRIGETAAKHFYELKSMLSIPLGELDERTVILVLQKAVANGMTIGIEHAAKIYDIHLKNKDGV